MLASGFKAVSLIRDASAWQPAAVVVEKNMLSACVVGSFGALLTTWIAVHHLGLGLSTALTSVVAANAAGFLALLVIMRSRYVRRGVLTWAIVVSVYLVVVLGTVKALRDPRVFGWLLIPLILSTGFGIIAYGPVQDWLVARVQRRDRERAAPRPE